MLRPFLYLILIPSMLFSQGLGEPENLGFYGGFTWDFEISEYQGRTIIFTAQSGGNQIYYAFLKEGQHPKNLKWKPLPATNLSKTTDIEAHNLEFHPKSGTLFWMQGFTRILSAGLQDENARPHDDFTDLVILGDTLVSLCYTCSPGIHLRRFTINADGDLNLIGADTIKAWNVGYEISVDPKTKQIICFSEDSVLISIEAYYHQGVSLGYDFKALSYPFDTLLQDPVYHIKENGEWLFLQSQNYYSDWFGTSDTSFLPRILSRSKDRGQTWTYELISNEWPIQGLLPPQISTATDKGQEIISAGSLYRLEGQPWKTIGRKYRAPGLFVYDGVSHIHPNKPSIAFHSGSYGPTVSTAFGDSLFLINEGIEAAHLCDQKYYPESRSLVVASEQRIGILQAAGLPQERWLWIPSLKEFLDFEISISYNEKKQVLYAATDKLYQYDLNQKEWTLILDPAVELQSPISEYDGIFDVTINPYQPSMLACIMENDRNYKSFTMLSRDGGASWDSLPALGDYYWFSRGTWRQTDTAYELHFSHRYAYFDSPGFDKVQKYIISDSGVSFAYDSLAGFQSFCNTIQYKFSDEPNVPSVALSDLDNPWENGDFQVLLKNGDHWDSIRGPRIPHCYVCYDYPRSIVADAQYAYVGAGHIIYRFDLREGQRKFDGIVYQYPRLENIRELEIIDNYLYAQGIYGLYRHKLDYITDPQHPIEPWALYPNPSTGIIQIQPPSSFEVFDLNGQKVYTSEGTQYTADLSNLKPGIYLIKTPDQRAKRWIKY